MWLVGENGLVSRTHVVVGELVGSDMVEIKSGVDSGDTLVVAGTGAMREGLKVKPVVEVTF